jgi:nucleotidyltransferase/DNA polymerase involved in DNA repair
LGKRTRLGEGFQRLPDRDELNGLILLVEPLSMEEAFLNVTGSAKLFGTPFDIARKIKRAVVDEIGLTVSAGVAPCKFVIRDIP